MDKLINNFIARLNDNYNTYKNEMLKNSKEEIFAQAYHIHFCECLYDYLSQYVWDETDEHKYRLEMLCGLQDMLLFLWSVYIENEWLGYITWEEIEDLMGEFYRLKRI